MYLCRTKTGDSEESERLRNENQNLKEEIARLKKEQEDRAKMSQPRNARKSREEQPADGMEVDDEEDSPRVVLPPREEWPPT